MASSLVDTINAFQHNIFLRFDGKTYSYTWLIKAIDECKAQLPKVQDKSLLLLFPMDNRPYTIAALLALWILGHTALLLSKSSREKDYIDLVKPDGKVNIGDDGIISLEWNANPNLCLLAHKFLEKKNTRYGCAFIS